MSNSLRKVSLLLFILFPVIVNSNWSVNSEVHLEKPVLEARNITNFEPQHLILAPQNDSIKKQKRERKKLSEKNKETAGKVGLAIHIVYTISSGILFFALLYSFNKKQEDTSCFGAILMLFLHLMVLAFGITFGVLTFTLLIHLIARHILKKSKV